MSSYKPGTFDSRVVEYEKVHQITDDQIFELIKAIDLKPNQKVLDGCCGYGSVTRWLIGNTHKDTTKTCSFFLLDNSVVQIERAKENLGGQSNITYMIGDIKFLPYENNFFDVVIIKMGLHENPKEVQDEIIREVFRVLRPGGKFVVWELYLNDLTQPILKFLINKKDELAGFDSLVQKRYFPRREEIISSISKAGFENFIEHYIFKPQLNTKVRLDELISRELKEKGLAKPDETLQRLAEKRLNDLNNFLRVELAEEQKRIIDFSDQGDNIIIRNIDKAIVSATKPL